MAPLPHPKTPAIASDVDFPRGKAPASALKQAKAESTTQDNLFPVCPSLASIHRQVVAADTTEKKRVHKRKSNSDEQQSKKIKVDGLSMPKVRPLRYRTLVVGMSLLGAIKEVHDLELVVSLPNHLTGTIAITEISDALSKTVERAIAASAEDSDIDDDDAPSQTKKADVEMPDLRKMFKVGQLVRCIIVELTDVNDDAAAKKRIDLSMKPHLVNANLDTQTLFAGMTLQAAVQSCEDHGYVIDTGIKGITAFLPKKDTRGAELVAGQPIECSIVKPPTAQRRAMTLTVDPMAAQKPITSKNLLLSTLQPGMLVNARVQRASSQGVWVKFLDFFEGTIDWLHASRIAEGEAPAQDLAQSFTEGQKIRARILYTFPGDDDNMEVDVKQRVALTFLPNLVDWAPFQYPEDIQIGKVVNDASIVRTDGSLGVLLSIQEGALLAFTHISRVSDERVENLDPKKYRVGSTHRCRIVSFDPLDGIVQASMEQSVIDAKFFRYEDVLVGQVISDARVIRLDATTGNLLMSLSPSTDIRARCLPSHFADVPKISNPEKRFKQNDKLKVRVLSVDAPNRRVLVTHKKTLVTSKLPFLLSIEEAANILKDAGELWTHGVVTGTKPYGIFVTCGHRIKGLIHINEIKGSVAATENPLEHFTIGQVVKCRVISANTESQRLKLTLNDSAHSASANSASSLIGTIVSDATVSAVFAAEQYALVSLPEHGVTGCLHLSQLSDHIGHCDALFKRLQPGDVLPPLAVIAKEKKDSSTSAQVTLSTKKSIIAALEQPDGAIKFPLTYDKIAVGSVVLGHVRRVDEKLGVFLECGGHVSGLVLKHNLSSSFIKDFSTAFAPGQTVIAVVTEYQQEKNRLALSLKSSDVIAAMGEHSDAYYERLKAMTLDYFDEARDIVGSGSDEIKIGSIVECKVKSILGNVGAVAELAGDFEGLIAQAQLAGGKALKAGDSVKARIIDVDVSKKIADLTARPAFLAKPKKSKKTVVASLDKLVDATVELVKPDYVIVNCAGTLAFALTAVANDITKSHLKYRVGQKVHVRLASVECERPLAILALPHEVDAVEKTQKSSKATGAVAAAIDTSISSLTDIKEGMKIRAFIRSIKDAQMNMIIARGDDTAVPPVPPVYGRVHITEVIDSLADLPESKRAISVFEAMGYKQGTEIEAVVIGFHDARTHRWLPLSHPQGTRCVVELSVKPSVIKNAGSETNRVQEASDLNEDDQVLGFVQDYFPSPTKYALWVNVGTTLRGRVGILDLTNDPAALGNIQKSFPKGTALACRVVAKDESSGMIDVSAKGPDAINTNKLESLRVNSVILGRVTKVTPESGLNVLISTAGDGIVGRVHLTDLADKYEEDLCSKYRRGMYVRCCIVAVDLVNKRVDLSLRPSRLGETAAVEDAEISTAADLEDGAIVCGFVKNIASNGCFVSIGRNVAGRVKIAELSDDFVKDWSNLYRVGQLVKAKVLGLDADSGKVELSLKASAVDPDAAEKMASNDDKITFDSLSIGEQVTGTVVRIETYGAFVEIDNSKASGKRGGLRGLCHKSELADSSVDDIGSLYSVGDRVKAIVLNLDAEKKNIALGLKPSYFEQDGDTDMESASDDESMDQDLDDASSQSNGDESDAEEHSVEQDSDADEASAADSDAVVENDNDDAERMDVDAAPLASGVGFNWDGTWQLDNGDSDDSQDASEGEDAAQETSEKTKKLSKRAKARAKRLEEESIAQSEAAIASGTAVPQTAEDFDRLIMASPNSSFVWIQYMALYVNLVELDKARQVAERALKTMNYREEKEKFNVWMAYLNLENQFGTPESLKQVLDRAVAYNDAKHVYLSLAKIYEKTEKFEQAEEAFAVAAKKFKQSCKVWVQFGLYWFFRGKLADARKLLQRSLQSLPKRKHVKIITKFAQFEYKHGDAERGRTVFEGLVSNYPKRVDLWSIYLDMEIRKGDLQSIRHLFERLINMRFSSKKMKFFFKRYLDFEKKQGEEVRVNHVIDAARRYVESITAGAEQDEEEDME